jgi:transcriptional regulator with XRE-family HTH domain
VPILLRRWRERRGYSVRELARRAGVTHVTVVRIENDQVSPTVMMLERLAKALRIDARDLLVPLTRNKRTRRR